MIIKWETPPIDCTVVKLRPNSPLVKDLEDRGVQVVYIFYDVNGVMCAAWETAA